MSTDAGARGRRCVLVAVCALLALAPVAQAKKPSAFRVPEEQFRATVKTLGMMSPLVGSNVPHADVVMATYDSLVEAELTAAGFTVIPAMEYDRMWALGVDSVGGLFDPRTGVADSVKLKALRAQINGVMRDRFHADAIVRSVFVPTTADFSGGSARWDGAQQDAAKGFGGALLAMGSVGSIPAISLYLWVEDLDGNPLYFNPGGVQVLAKLAGNGQFADVPEDSLLTRPDFNARAVHAALKPLVAPEPQKRKKQK